MKGPMRGFGLIEMMLALALSLVVVLGVTRIFISAKNTYLSQNAAATLQEDGRFVLSKLMQEVRMVGMFGCLATVVDASAAGDFTANAATPVRWDNASRRLTLVTADVGLDGGGPTWTVLSDCRDTSTAYSGARVAGVGQQAFAIRRLSYRLDNRQLVMGTGTGNDQAVLVSDVEAFEVSFGMARSASDTGASRYSPNPEDPQLIRSVRLSLTLADPLQRVASQTFTVVAALRNRLR